MEEHSDSRKVQYLVCLAVSLAAVTAGVSVYWSTPMIPKFHDHQADLDITEEEVSWMASMSSPGYMAGSLASRFLADSLGRRLSILATALPITLGTILVLCATKAWMLYITRFLWGCGTGLFVTVSSIYLVEIADKDIRGALSVGSRLMFNFGSFLVMSIGPFVAYQTLNFMLLALPIIYFVACWWIPETPYYFLKEGKVESARKDLQILRGYKDEKVLEDQLSVMQSDVSKEMRRSGTAKELFTGKQYRRAIIVAVGIKLTQVMSGSIPIQQYLGRIIQESNTKMEVSTALIIFGAIRFVVGIFATLFVDKIGRRPLLILSYFGTSLCLATVGVYFYYQEVVGIENESSSPYRHITFIGIILGTVLSTLGFDSLIFVIPAEIFPINVKSIAMTSYNIFGGCMNFVAVKGYQEVKNLAGLHGVFLYFAVSALIGSVFSYFVAPETKGKSLRQIQIELQGNIYDEGEESLNKDVGENENAKEIVVADSVELKELNNETDESFETSGRNSNCASSMYEGFLYYNRWLSTRLFVGILLPPDFGRLPFLNCPPDGAAVTSLRTHHYTTLNISIQ
ncbi:hypothetical protein K1T71_007099 [Dendrolimus kikuchii]|uniref:Uncharacterized protein n=1 Tax=Dendrolimus kikuchii TaxID=765133 RepID=A0ACC1CZP2_9NEOP|nr:hypothetical protein K1T71_007099 [Dendrolimus kikuchii]